MQVASQSTQTKMTSGSSSVLANGLWIIWILKASCKSKCKHALFPPHAAVHDNVYQPGQYSVCGQQVLRMRWLRNIRLRTNQTIACSTQDQAGQKQAGKHAPTLSSCMSPEEMVGSRASLP